MSAEDPMGLARELIAHDIPVVVCTPHVHRSRCSPKCRRELDQPTGWQTVSAADTAAALERFRPGIDTLAMVAGHGVDVVDIDAKAGGDPSMLPAFEHFGVHRTPSGGWHYFVRGTGIGKLSPFAVHDRVVGDYCGGTRAGGGRLLVYLPGSTRPKYPDAGYTVESPLDLDKLLDSDPDDTLVAVLIGAGGRDDTRPGAKAAPGEEVAAFLAEHSEKPERLCNYGRAAVRAMKKDAATAEDAKGGRHGWAVRSALRLVELIRGGCCWSGDVDTLEAELDRIKPEGGTDWSLVLAYALGNASGATACGLHAPEAEAPADPPRADAAVITLGQAHAVFARWLGRDYDGTALDATLGTAASERLDGDPAWLLIVSGSGAAKTETAQALASIGAHITSTITSEGALLSATSTQERTRDATGGLLRKIGQRGVLVIKDVTSVLSMNRDARAAVLAALREVYDGRWERNVGSDGGKTLTWTGRIVVIGAVTTAWDSAHAVVAAMGDRFLLVRVDSREGRRRAGLQALRNVGHEVAMRAELADAVAGVMAGLDPALATLDGHDVDVLLDVADVVTLARTAVERDYQGNVIDAHAPEMPTRFAKQLGQLARGCRALGMDREQGLTVALRVARDSMPPPRLLVLADVLAHPGSLTSEVTKRVQKPRTSVDRVLQELHVLGLVTVDDDVVTAGDGSPRTRWRYTLADRDGLADVITRFVGIPTHSPSETRTDDVNFNLHNSCCTDKSGDNPGADAGEDPSPPPATAGPTHADGTPCAGMFCPDPSCPRSARYRPEAAV